MMAEFCVLNADILHISNSVYVKSSYNKVSDTQQTLSRCAVSDTMKLLFVCLIDA